MITTIEKGYLFYAKIFTIFDIIRNEKKIVKNGNRGFNSRKNLFH